MQKPMIPGGPGGGARDGSLAIETAHAHPRCKRTLPPHNHRRGPNTPRASPRVLSSSSQQSLYIDSNHHHRLSAKVAAEGQSISRKRPRSKCRKNTCAAKHASVSIGKNQASPHQPSHVSSLEGMKRPWNRNVAATQKRLFHCQRTPLKRREHILDCRKNKAAYEPTLIPGRHAVF